MNVLEVTKVFGFKICILIPVYGAGGVSYGRQIAFEKVYPVR